MKIISVFIIVLLFSCSDEKRPVAQVLKELDRNTYTEEDTTDYRREFTSLYLDTLRVDTTFEREGQLYKGVFKHFCTQDNSLVIPAKYNWDIKKDFVTHNFLSNIYLLRGADTIFSKSISKADFLNLLDPALKDYGTLLYPHLVINEDSLKISYSISIPVTDVGKRVWIQFDSRGNHTIGQ